MTKDSFVNLHLHTHYSIGDSTIKIPELFYQVEQYNQSAVAITDHGSVEGWTEFFNVARDSNVKPIFGNEFYCKETLDKPVDTNRFHLVILAKNNNGAKLINQLQYIAIQHHHYKPLLPYPKLFELDTDDLFISTACSLGTIGQSLDPTNKVKKFDEAKIFLNKLLDHFGKDNVALEFQFHPDYPAQKDINDGLLFLYDNVDVKYCTVTTDAHFLTNRAVRRYVQADTWNKLLNDVTPTLKSNCLGKSDLIYKFAEESDFTDTQLVNKMIHNTKVIADQCNVTEVNNIGQGRLLPKFNKHRQFKKIFLKQPRVKE